MPETSVLNDRSVMMSADPMHTINCLKKEIEELQKDAERYRAWRAAYTVHDTDLEPCKTLFSESEKLGKGTWSEKEFDALSDAVVIAAFR